MGIAVVLHVLSFVMVMGPIFYQSFEFFSTNTDILLVQTTWLHAVPGAISLLLAIFLVVKLSEIWFLQPLLVFLIRGMLFCGL